MGGFLRRRDMMRIDQGGGGGLPPEYQQVEYIGCNPGPWFNLDLSLTKNSVIDVRFWWDGVYNNQTQYNYFLFGGRSSATSNNLQFYRNNGAPFCLDYSNYKQNRKTTPAISGEWLNLHIDSSGFTLGDVSMTFSASTSAFTTPYTYVFDAYNKASGVGWNGRLSSFTVANQCDLVPCYRISDGVIGMYDVIRERFFYNQGGGSFYKGADI